MARWPEGEVLARAEQGYPLSTPRPGWSEQDPEDWWRAAQATLAAVAAAGVKDVRGIGLSGQMHGLVCLDERGKVLRPAMLWNDQRTGAECAEIESRIGRKRLIELTGIRALTVFTAPKILWLRHHEPDVYARISRILLPKDYVRLRLTGEHAIDVADASGTLLFDVAHRRWSEEVTEALEIPRSWLPRALESPEVSGSTAEGVAVAAGAGDQAAGALGVGVDPPGPGGAARVRAGMEGVAYGLRDSLELLTDLGVRADRGRASGGGARSRLWLSIVASVLRLPLELTAVEEGSAFGAALLGGVAGGGLPHVNQAVRAWVRVRQGVEPQLRWHEGYQAGDARFPQLYPALTP